MHYQEAIRSMKYIVSLFLTLVLASPTLAAEFKPAKTFKNAKLKAIVAAMKAFGTQYTGTGAYSITKKSPLKGRTEAERRRDTCKETLHRYSGAMLDEGIDLRSVFKNEEGVKFALSYLTDFEQNDERPWPGLQKALSAATSDKTLEVYAGTGGGNNTMAAMLCVYDTENDQVVYLILSNFGSDN